MTWLSRICISFALAGVALSAGTISGRVELVDSRDADVRRKSDYSGVVISLEPVTPSLILNTAAAAPQRVKMLQKSKTFQPHILAVAAGTTVDFPNLDPIFHSAFSNYNGQIFDVGLYPPGTSRAVRFSRPGVVRIFCNIHDHMSAVVVVLGTPWFDTTGADGRFEISDVPPGEYRIHIFHERASSDTLNNLARTITIGAETVTLPPISISESGFLPMPHKNKYGRDYIPPPSEQGLYPSVKK